MNASPVRDSDVNIVLQLHPSPHHARHSEGSFITLRDGRLLFVYTRYNHSARDDGEASLTARESHDAGNSWSDRDTTVVQAEPGLNVMSVSLLRLHDGRIALFHLKKIAHHDWQVLLRTSSDEAATWSAPIVCNDAPGIHVLNNDRVVQLRRGRLLLPVATATPEQGPGHPEQRITCLLSDDAGHTWRRSRSELAKPGVWTQEPGVVELNDDRLLLWCRTQVGCQYTSESRDGGETWSPLQPSPLVSTLSPASIKRIPSTGDLLCVWNRVDQPWGDWDSLQRSPLHSAISRDEGRTWQHLRVLESDPGKWYCYTAIHFVEDTVLLAHAAGAGRTYQRLGTQQLTRRPLAWFYQ